MYYGECENGQLRNLDTEYKVITVTDLLVLLTVIFSFDN